MSAEKTLAIHLTAAPRAQLRAPASPSNSTELLAALGRDFPRVWNHPDADARLRKRILRAAIHEILVKPSDDGLLLQVTIHWQGDVHTQCTVDRPVRVRERANKSIAELVTALAVDLDDRDLARVLNMNGTTTPGGLRWTQDRVRDYRRGGDPPINSLVSSTQTHDLQPK